MPTVYQRCCLSLVSYGHLQRAYLPAGRQGLFPLAEAGDPPDMMPSEQVTSSTRSHRGSHLVMGIVGSRAPACMQVITVSGYRVETDEHPWAQAVLTDGAPSVMELRLHVLVLRRRQLTPCMPAECFLAQYLLLAATFAVRRLSRNDTVPSFAGVGRRQPAVRMDAVLLPGAPLAVCVESAEEL